MIEMISDTEWFTFMLLLSQIALLGLQIRLFIEFAYVWDERHVHQRCYQSKDIEAHSLNLDGHLASLSAKYRRLRIIHPMMMKFLSFILVNVL